MRESGNTIATLQMYASRFSSAVFVDVGVIDKRFSNERLEYVESWHFFARIQELCVGDERILIEAALDRDSDMPINVRQQALADALSVFDLRLTERWQNQNWLDSIHEFPESERGIIRSDYVRSLIFHNKSAL